MITGCLLVSLLLLLLHVRMLVNHRNAIDRLDQELATVREHVPPGERLVFITDHKGADREELLYRAQFVLAPRVLCSTDGWQNTALVIDGGRWLADHPDEWSVLWQDEGDVVRTLLIQLEQRP